MPAAMAGVIRLLYLVCSAATAYCSGSPGSTLRSRIFCVTFVRLSRRLYHVIPAVNDKIAATIANTPKIVSVEPTAAEYHATPRDTKAAKLAVQRPRYRSGTRHALSIWSSSCSATSKNSTCGILWMILRGATWLFSDSDYFQGKLTCIGGTEGPLRDTFGWRWSSRKRSTPLRSRTATLAHVTSKPQW